jgi:hypothetical protein
MSEGEVTTKKELLEHIERDWSAINQLLDGLSDHQWTGITDAEGWTVKDHLTHLSAWENSVIALLTGKPRHEGLGVSEEVYFSEDYDVINQAICQNHWHDSLEEVRGQFQSTHAQLMRLIEPLSDEDLNQPYAHYLPDEPGEGNDRPAINLVYGNTSDHFREHQGWIEAMLDAVG